MIELIQYWRCFPFAYGNYTIFKLYYFNVKKIENYVIYFKKWFKEMFCSKQKSVKYHK